MNDTEAMNAIRALMDGKEWGVDTLNEISEVVSDTGRDIREPTLDLDDTPEADDSGFLRCSRCGKRKPDMEKRLETLLEACRLVFDRWEHGDLADAVRKLNHCVDDINNREPDHNSTYLLEALRGLVNEVKLHKLNVRKDFSLINAHAYALKAIHRAEEGGI